MRQKTISIKLFQLDFFWHQRDKLFIYNISPRDRRSINLAPSDKSDRGGTCAREKLAIKLANIANDLNMNDLLKDNNLLANSS